MRQRLVDVPGLDHVPLVLQLAFRKPLAAGQVAQLEFGCLVFEGTGDFENSVRTGRRLVESCVSFEAVCLGPRQEQQELIVAVQAVLGNSFYVDSSVLVLLDLQLFGDLFKQPYVEEVEDFLIVNLVELYGEERRLVLELHFFALLLERPSHHS